MTACAPSEFELPAMNSLLYVVRRASPLASVVRNATRPNAWMNEVAQLDAGAPVEVAAQEANCASLPADAAQAAIASALSSSWEALRSWTSRLLASIEKPSTAVSLNTVATGAAL